MSFFRTRLSAAVAWGMIPLALWSGMPSTACVCANGHIKLFCQQLLGGAQSHLAAGLLNGCKSTCCSHEAQLAEAKQTSDCCGGGFCCHGAPSAKAGLGSKGCCKPILTAPSVAPQIASVPCDQAPGLAAVVREIGAIVHPAIAFEPAEFDTGPPLDRVIVFRSLLI